MTTIFAQSKYVFVSLIKNYQIAIHLALEIVVAWRIHTLSLWVAALQLNR